MDQDFDIFVKSNRWQNYTSIDGSNIVKACYKEDKINDTSHFDALVLYLEIYHLETILNPHLN